MANTQGHKGSAEYFETPVDLSPTRTREDDDRLRETGVNAEDIAPGYWRSPKVIGSCIAIILLANNLFWGYAVPVNVLSVINTDLGPSPNIYLVSLVNTLIKGVCTLLVGSISDAVGRRYFIIGGQAISCLGAVLSATAKDVNWLIGAQVFIGMAGSVQVMYPLLVQEIVPNKYRGWSQAVITVLVLPSIGFGPIVGRTMILNLKDIGGWRWCYWLHGILSLISLILLVLCYFPPDFHQIHGKQTRMQQLMSIDYGGVILYGGSLVCILLGLSWGGRQYHWNDPKIIALIVVGCILLIVFVLYEYFMKLKQPLLPLSLFKIRNYNVMVIVGSVGQMSYYAMNIFWPTQVTNLYTQDIRLVGWMTCTTGLALMVGEIITGPFFKKFGNVKWQLVVGCIGLTTIGGCMALGNEHRQDLAISLTIVNGLFIGWIELVAIVAAGLVVPPELIGTAQAFFASCRASTGTMASSIYLAIYNNENLDNIPKKVTAAVLQAGLPESSVPQMLKAVKNGTAAAYGAVPGTDAAITAAARAGYKAALSASFHTVYLSTIAFGATALIVSFFATDVNEYLTSYVNKVVTNDKQHLKDVENSSTEKM